MVISWNEEEENESFSFDRRIFFHSAARDATLVSSVRQLRSARLRTPKYLYSMGQKK